MEQMYSLFSCGFHDLDHNFLRATHTRNLLISYYTNEIRGCSRQEGVDPSVLCEVAIQGVINYHTQVKGTNREICLMGKYHNVLYIAAKLCYDFNVTNSSTVALLLTNIFMCEQNFERLYTGALFDRRVSNILTGWQSDFSTREENTRAIVYFLDHATRFKCEYDLRGVTVRFVDVPMDSYGLSPLEIALEAGLPELIHIFLKFGAHLDIELDEENPRPLHQFLRRLIDCEMQTQEVPIYYVTSLTFLLRALPSIAHLLFDPLDDLDNNQIEMAIFEKYIPDSHLGKTPPSLMHLCKLKIRECLWQNFQLPHGIDTFCIPEQLKEYLNLNYD